MLDIVHIAHNGDKPYFDENLAAPVYCKHLQ